MASQDPVEDKFAAEKGKILQRARSHEFDFLKGNVVLVANMTDDARAQKAIFEALKQWKAMEGHAEKEEWGEAIFCAHLFLRLVEEEKVADRKEPRLMGQSLKIHKTCMTKIEGKLEAFDEGLKAKIKAESEGN